MNSMKNELLKTQKQESDDYAFEGLNYARRLNNSAQNFDIVTFTLNPTIDRTFLLEENLIPGETNRVAKSFAIASGKGLCAARMANNMGERVLASGFVGGDTGKAIIKSCDEYGIPHDFVQCSGESRTNISVKEKDGELITELLMPGPVINESELAATKRKVSLYSRPGKLIVFGGSLPRGVKADFYQELIGIAKQNGALPICLR